MSNEGPGSFTSYRFKFPETFELMFPASKTKWIWVGLVSIILGFGGIIGIQSGEAIGWVVVAFFGLGLLLEHHIFPLAGRIVDELFEIYLANISGWIQVDPEVLVVEDGLNSEVGAVIESVLTARSWFNED